MAGADIFVPTFLVKINGKRLPQEMAADMMSISVEEHIECPTLFTLTFSDRERKWIQSGDFSEGTAVAVELGYLNETASLFDGEVTGFEAEYPLDGPCTSVLKGYDRLHRLVRDRKTRTFKEMKDSQIAQEIAGGVSLDADTEATDEVLDYVLQNAQSDLDFLLERGRRAGRELGISGKTLTFKKPSENLSEVAVLEWGKSLLEFSANVTSVKQISGVQVRGWDPKEQKAIVGKAGAETQSTTMKGEQSGAEIVEDSFGRCTLVVHDNSVKSQAEADNLAKVYFRDRSMGYIQAQGSCLGNPQIRVGKTVSLKGLCDKLDGTYYVVGTEHELNERGYVTHFQVQRNAR